MTTEQTAADNALVEAKTMGGKLAKAIQAERAARDAKLRDAEDRIKSLLAEVERLREVVSEVAHCPEGFIPLALLGVPYKEIVADRQRMREALESAKRRLQPHPDDNADDDKRDKRLAYGLISAALNPASKEANNA